jgi:hypothetical protein
MADFGRPADEIEVCQRRIIGITFAHVRQANDYHDFVASSGKTVDANASI